MLTTAQHTPDPSNNDTTDPLFSPPHTREPQEAARKRLLAAAAAKEASGEALYEVAKMYDAGEYKMVPNPKKALEFYQAVSVRV